MTLERNLFITQIEIFWVHTALFFDDCLEQCIGWFSPPEVDLFYELFSEPRMNSDKFQNFEFQA